MKEETKNEEMAVDRTLGNVVIQIGMHVKIKEDFKNFAFNAGKVKTITKELEKFGGSRAFALDGDTGIWCIEDFEECIEHPGKIMS